MKIICSYCRKEVDEDESVERDITFLHGGMLLTRPRKYCCKQCAEYDQMAHEL